MSRRPENVTTLTQVETFKLRMEEQRIVRLNRPVAEEIYEFLLHGVDSRQELFELNMKFVGLNSRDGELATVCLSRRDINKSALLIEDACDKTGDQNPEVRRLVIAFDLLDKKFVEGGGMESNAFGNTLGRIKAQIDNEQD